MNRTKHPNSEALPFKSTPVAAPRNSIGNHYGPYIMYSAMAGTRTQRRGNAIALPDRFALDNLRNASGFLEFSVGFSFRIP